MFPPDDQWSVENTPPRLQQVRQKAVDEMMQPTLDLTRQFLQVLTLKMETGEPIIAAIREEPTETVVFFPVEGEDYFLTLSIDTNNGFAVRWIQTEPGS